MALFQFRWLRRFVRRHTNPIAEDAAEVWKRRLSLGYMLLAWNAFGFVCYMVFTGKADWAKAYGVKSQEEQRLTPAQQWARTLGIKKATVYRIDGFNVTKYEVDQKMEENKQNEAIPVGDEVETS